MIVERRLRASIEAQLRLNPAVVLLGPRQVGKTTLAREIVEKSKSAAVYLDLERPADRRRLEDADAYLRAQDGKLVVVDEIHKAPELFGTLRGIIDDRRRQGDRTGHFLLLGSASLDLMKQASETLAGRVVYVELAPMDALEIAGRTGDLNRTWSRGGFPDSLLARSDAESLQWRRAFVRSYLEREVPMFAPRMPAETVGRLWTMLAHGQGTLLNQSGMAAGLAVSTPTVGRYVDLLVDLMLVRRLRPWSGNVGKRLVRTPKTYVRDSGITHALLDLETWNDVVGHPVAGPSWEGFVIENLIATAGGARLPFFYRTEDGAEVDLLFERAGKVEMIIEIKHSTAPEVSRGFHSARATLKPKQSYLLHGGTGTWPVDKNITAIGLRDLMGRLLSG
jgi:uncharacterized protein